MESSESSKIFWKTSAIGTMDSLWNAYTSMSNIILTHNSYSRDSFSWSSCISIMSSWVKIKYVMTYLL
jgi:hypothetical protein